MRFRLKTLSVAPSTGVVSTGVPYWNGSTDTPTTDGIAGVLVLATRTLAALAAPANSFLDMDDSYFWSGQKLGSGWLKNTAQ